MSFSLWLKNGEGCDYLLNLSAIKMYCSLKLTGIQKVAMFKFALKAALNFSHFKNKEQIYRTPI